MTDIRQEKSADVAAIEQVLVASFPSAAEAGLVSALRQAGKLIVSPVAIQGSQVVGHVALSPVTLDPPSKGLSILGLAPVAVVPAQQRSGVGSQLVQRAFAAARDRCADAVVVLGEPRFYNRFGFLRADEFGLGNAYQANEHFMVIELRPGCLDGTRAIAKYAAEFALV